MKVKLTEATVGDLKPGDFFMPKVMGVPEDGYLTDNMMKGGFIKNIAIRLNSKAPEDQQSFPCYIVTVEP